MNHINYTIIIPTYQGVERLPVVLKSIPPRDDIQVIVVDDNSYPDRTIVSQAVQSLRRKNVELYFNDTGVQSAGAARNVGLRYAKGKWLIFADDDDWFPEGAFDAFDKHCEDLEDIVFFVSSSYSRGKKRASDRNIRSNMVVHNFIRKVPLSEIDIRYGVFSPTTKMVRRSMVEEHQIRFDQCLFGNDVVFSTKCSYYAKKVAAYPNVTYVMLSRGDSLTNNTSPENFCQRIEAHVRRCRFLAPRIPFYQSAWIMPVKKFNATNAYKQYGLKIWWYTFSRFFINGVYLWFGPLSLLRWYLTKGWYEAEKNTERKVLPPAVFESEDVNQEDLVV